MQNQVQLLELLEIPRLADSCVRNGLYEDALDLEAYVKSLSVRYKGVPVVQDITQEMNTMMRSVMRQLLMLLRGQIQLSMCLRIVGFLRRMESFDENGIRAMFLSSRSRWLKNILNHIPSPSTPYEVRM